MMSLLALFILQAVPVHSVAVPPILDGKIDSVWNSADSITEFTQWKPDYGKPSRFKTVVKFLQDRENLYILGVCYTGNYRPSSGFRNSDYLTIYIDPFLSKQGAYLFEVHASGKTYDATVSNRGNHLDFSWDAYWFSKVKIHAHYYVVEIKIPFRSIRFKKGLTKWGLQLERYIPQRNEVSYWKLYPRDRMSDPAYYGELSNVNPGVSGHGMEFYPVSVLRRDSYSSVPVKNSHIGFDFSWSILPDLMLNITVKPDFAQIEADPFALNLSKFEMYFSEKRPFFVEGKEIFSPVSINFGDVFTPFVVFYSRRIGKRLPDGREVPIDFGGKLTYKSSKMQFGWISVHTDEKTCSTGDKEPAAFWSVASLKLFPSENLSTGLLVSSKSSGGKTAFNLDFNGSVSHGSHQVLYQWVVSKEDSVTGYGFNSAYLFVKLPWIIAAGISRTGKNLDLSSTGYLARDPGINMTSIIAHITYPEKSMFIEKTKAMYFKVSVDSTNRTSSFMVGPYFSITTRGGTRLELFGFSGKSFEFNLEKVIYGAHVNLSKSGGEGTHFGFYGDVSRTWNYQREIFAPVAYGGLWVSFSLTDHINGETDLKYWMEFDTSNNLIDTYITFKPDLRFVIRPDMDIVLSTEIVPVYTDRWNLNEVRSGLRYEFDFRPKSKIYIVANRRYVKTGGKLREVESIYALKVRVAIPF